MNDCRWCAQPIEFRGFVRVAGTGPGGDEHWRHTSGQRHCSGGLGAIAEPALVTVA